MEDKEPDLSESENDSSSETSSQVGDGDSIIEDTNSYIEEDEQENEDEDDQPEPSEDGSNGDVLEGHEMVENPSDNEDDEEEEEDEDYLQKMNEDVRKKVIEDFHPELKTLNYEEVEALATVIRDTQNVIIDPLHQTMPILTRYEKARILGERARQINAGASPMIEVEPTLIDGYLIALKELEQKRIPFIIQRPLPNGTSEYWRVSDLE